MELFPAQPDLSLQISPPNTKPTRRPDPDHLYPNPTPSSDTMDLGFWKRVSDKASNNKPTNSEAAAAFFDLSLSHHHHHQHPTLSAASSAVFHHQNHHQLYHHLLHGAQQPIRGIPVYQNPPSFPFAAPQPLDAHPHSPSSMAGSGGIPNGAVGSAAPNHHHHHHLPYHQGGMMRTRFGLSRFPAKRSMRAPRMRWTSTLHARFVHAVELLGGHESMDYIHLHFASLTYPFF